MSYIVALFPVLLLLSKPPSTSIIIKLYLAPACNMAVELVEVFRDTSNKATVNLHGELSSLCM